MTMHTPEKVERILEERAQTLAQPAEEDVQAEETQHVVAFVLGGEQYAVDITQVLEVQPLGAHPWTRVPGTPDFVVGVVNLRGEIFTVVDVAHLLDLPVRPLSETAHVLIVEGKDAEGVDIRVGILADEVPRAVHIPRSQVHPPTKDARAREHQYVRGITSDTLVLLDLERLLADPRIIVYEEV